MAFKIPVIDRVPTYPGRVKLTPVSGQDNVYDMVRSDSPVEPGTPINKALFDQKAYTLTEDVTVYVSTSGSDVTGTGEAVAPYATVQKAINELPKCLGGYHAQIDIANGTYEEAVTIDSFYGGRLTLGISGRTVVLRGITVMSSDSVRINVAQVKRGTTSPSNLVHADYGSNVSIMSNMIIHGENGSVSGLTAARGSLVTSGVTVEIRGCKSAAVYASGGARIALGAINGTSANTSYAIRADMGGVVSYSSQGLTATLGNITASGGRILNGSGTTLANSSIE
jgi:hypothetical protein